VNKVVCFCAFAVEVDIRYSMFACFDFMRRIISSMQAIRSKKLYHY
jgi:hypothetical protein